MSLIMKMSKENFLNGYNVLKSLDGLEKSLDTFCVLIMMITIKMCMNKELMICAP